MEIDLEFWIKEYTQEVIQVIMKMNIDIVIIWKREIVDKKNNYPFCYSHKENERAKAGSQYGWRKTSGNK